MNEVTSLEVDKNGLATVMGDGPAYFVLADHAPEVCQAGVPLTYSNFKIWKVPRGRHLRPQEPSDDRLLPAQRQQRRDQLEPVLRVRVRRAGRGASPPASAVAPVPGSLHNPDSRKFKGPWVSEICFSVRL